MDNLDITGRVYDRLQVLEREERPFSEKERLRAINGPLLDWYESHARVLPWREDPTPYRVWISEIMLQQTRVEAVKPYFERFLEALPDIGALAAVEDDQLMKLWQGLGYYNRARNLKKAALQVMEQYDGEMPSEYEDLLGLAGIGSYTAGAIASIAFGRAVPAVDGNVLRVMSRVLGSYEDILKQSTKTWMENLLRETMPKQRVSHFNQGLIEIGAIVCIPNGAPKCTECPLASVCIARRDGLTDQIPVKTPAKKRRLEDLTVCIIESRMSGKIAIHKRDDNGLLAALYELPNVQGHLERERLADAFYLDPDRVIEVERLDPAKHIFSHVEWHMIGYRLLIDGELPKQWIGASKEEIQDVYALPNAFIKYTKLLKVESKSRKKKKTEENELKNVEI
jgi:A/G-specific adenine glycosylase